VAGRARLGQNMIPSVGTCYWAPLRPVPEHIPCDIHILSGTGRTKSGTSR